MRCSVAFSFSCPTSTSVVLFASSVPLYVELGFFAATDYLLNFDPRNQQTSRDYWTANWFASGSTSSTINLQSGTSYSMTVQVGLIVQYELSVMSARMSPRTADQTGGRPDRDCTEFMQQWQHGTMRVFFVRGTFLVRNSHLPGDLSFRVICVCM